MNRIFLGYPWDIPYPKKTDNNNVPANFWDIPGISHIPKIDKVGMYRLYFGIYPYPIFFLTYVPRVRKIEPDSLARSGRYRRSKN